MKRYITIDIGGTYVKYGIIESVKEKLEITEHHHIKTPSNLSALLKLISSFANEHHNITGIAISSPGAVSKEGIVYGDSALSYLHGPNIKELIEDRTDLPVYIENDANCAAYAELCGGSAQQNNSFIMMVIGTGIGGAIVKDKRLHKGAHLHGGEFGYMLLSDFTSNELVRMDSTASMIRNAEDMKGIRKGSLTGEELFRLASLGDQECIRAIDKFYRLLSIGIFNLQYIYDPEVILIGGGISSNESLLTELELRIDGIFNEMSHKATIRPRLELAHFKQHANLYGSVYGFIKEDHL